jgi:hypothetical protein
MLRWLKGHTAHPNMKKEEDLDPATTTAETVNVILTLATGLQTRRRTVARTRREK